MRYFVSIAGRTVEIDLSGNTPLVDGQPLDAELVAVPGTPLRHLVADGESHTYLVRPDDRRGRWHLASADSRYSAEVVDERTRAIREMTGAAADDSEKTVLAPMPGLVARVEVEVGQEVRAGQGVVIVEAMKMENELRAPADGVVSRIEVQAGQTVEKGATLIVLE